MSQLWWRGSGPRLFHKLGRINYNGYNIIRKDLANTPRYNH